MPNQIYGGNSVLLWPQIRKPCGVGVVKHRREMSADFLDLANSDVGLEDLGEDIVGFMSGKPSWSSESSRVGGQRSRLRCDPERRVWRRWS